MVFHFIEMVGLTGRLWEPDVLYGQSKPITGDREGFRCLSQVQALICQLNFTQGSGER